MIKRVMLNYNTSTSTTARSEKAIVGRWKSLTTSHKFNCIQLQCANLLRHIRDWSRGTLLGSTGKENWWELEEEERKKSLGDKVQGSFYSKLTLYCSSRRQTHR